MASVLQFQRRAIESLEKHLIVPAHAIELLHALRPIFSLNFRLCNGPAKVIGISRGVGTGSDKHGMNVLVLSANPLAKPREAVTLEQAWSCAYAALTRRATSKEVAASGLYASSRISCVELLHILDITVDYTNMEPTGPVACYVAVI